MIVRIMTDNQYRLGDEQLDAVHQLDDQLVHTMDAHDERGFQSALHALVALVRQHGTLVPMDEVVPSDVLIPAPDMTLDEAQRLIHSAEKPAQVEQPAPAAGDE